MLTAVESLTTPTRRRVISALSGAAIAGTALVIAAPPAETVHPDAELLAALAEFTALERQIYPANPPKALAEEAIWDDAVKPLRVRQRAALELAVALPTHTLDGFRGRARALLTRAEYLLQQMEDGGNAGFYPEKMQLAILRDLAGEHAA